ncbi:hypothetical protein RB597_001917 [Gaeumannomyces tritici]
MWLIRSLPRELFDGILDLLELQDLARLSSACHDLRATVAPRLFGSIVLTDDTRVADSAWLAARRYGIFARRLKIVVSSLGCTNPDCDYDWDCSPGTEAYYVVANPENGGIPASAVALLGGLEGALPALESITIEFPARYKHSFMLFGNHWDRRAPRVVRMRNSVAMVVRAVMAALARNTCISHLSLVNYPPLDPLGERRTSPGHRDTWERLLGRLVEFRLSLYGESLGGTGAAEMLGSRDYNRFLHRLQTFFLDHIRSIRRLTIRCSQHAPLGSIIRAGFKASFFCALGLDPDAMPFLEHLELANMFLGAELAGFLVGRAERPMSLSFTNIKADDVVAGKGYAWKQFFDELVENRVFIWRLEWVPSSTPFREPWWRPEITASKPAEEIMAQDPSRRAFPYAWGQFENPCLGDQVHRNIQSVVEGVDQEAYDKFMHLVGCNERRRRGL